MLKKLRLTIKGRFQMDEFKNLLCDKVARFNLEQLDPTHKPVKGYVDDRGETLMVVLVGEETDLKELQEVAERGPVFSQIESVTVSWEAPKGRYRGFGRKIHRGRGGGGARRGSRSKGGSARPRSTSRKRTTPARQGRRTSSRNSGRAKS